MITVDCLSKSIEASFMRRSKRRVRYLIQEIQLYIASSRQSEKASQRKHKQMNRELPQSKTIISIKSHFISEIQFYWEEEEMSRLYRSNGTPLRRRNLSLAKKASVT